METQTTVEIVEKLFTQYGVSGTLIGLLAWLVIKYGPRLIEAHINFVGAIKQQSQTLTAATSKIAEKQAEHVESTEAAVRALRHACDAAEVAIGGHPRESELRHHLAAIRAVLTD